MRTWTLILLSAVLCLAVSPHPAAADVPTAEADVPTAEADVPTAEADVPTAEAEVAPSDASASEPSRARQAYDEAFGLVVAGRCAEALPLLAEAQAGRDATLGTQAATLVRLCIARGQARPSLLAERRNAGRFPFVAWTTVAGLAAGIELDVALEPDTTTVAVGLPILTTGAAFGLSLLATRDADITVGEASLTGTGVVFGTYNAALLNIISDPGPAGAGITALAGTTLGAVTGFTLARTARMSAGDASLVGSGGLWGAVTGPLIVGLLNNLTIDEDTAIGVMLASTDLGLLFAGLATGHTELSRDRVLLMDLGALLGGLTLGGIGVILFNDAGADVGLPVTSAMALAGVYGGGALSLYLTRDMDASSDGPLATSLVHVDERGVHLGRPLPTLGPDLTRPGEVAVTLSLMAGTW